MYVTASPLYRGVDIMQVDSHGRGLEHYARDSWRMSEQEKVRTNFAVRLVRKNCRLHKI